MNYKIELERRLRNRLNRLCKIKNKQYNNNRTFEIIKKIRTSILIKENETFNKKERSGLRYGFKETRIKIIIFNIYET